MTELPNLLKNIKNKVYQPLYFLQGEEPYFIDQVMKSLENDILPEEERDFGLTILYGKDANVADIVAAARQYPMFGERQVILVKEAQNLALGEKERPILEAYAENPTPSTILAFGYKGKKLNGSLRLGKILSHSKAIFTADPIREDKMPAWISTELKSAGITAEPNVSHLLAEHLGNDLSRVANELQKLKIILKPGETLSAGLVESHIGISKDFNIFELQRAVGRKDAGAAMKIAYYLAKNMKNTPLVMVVGNLYTLFSNLIIYQTSSGASQQDLGRMMGVAPFFVKDYAFYSQRYTLKHATRALSVIREMDMKGKGLGVKQASQEDILTELVYKIVNIDRLRIKV